MKCKPFWPFSSAFFLLATGTPPFLPAAKAQDGPIPIDFNRWAVESHPRAYDHPIAVWTISQDSLSVLQSWNGEPTFFYSNFSAINIRFDASITVDDADDDYIGFALGFQPGDITNPNADYLLVDWKKGNQFADFVAVPDTPGSLARRGLAVSRVFGIATADEIWGHVNFDHSSSDLNSGVEELARGFNLHDAGWTRGQEHLFRLEFTATSLKVFVDGNLEIDIQGDFNEGRIAFYNCSQPRVSYTGSVVPLLDITTTSLPPGTEDQTYNHTLEATGGIKPYSWSVTTGSFPDGLTLDPNTGEIRGTPTRAAIGTWAFTVRAEDSQTPPDSDEKEFSIIVSARTLTLTVTPTSLVFTTRRSGSDPPNQTFTVTNHSRTPLGWMAEVVLCPQTVNWLQLTPTGGTLPGKESVLIEVSVCKSHLRVGRYEADIHVHSLIERKTVHVTLLVEPIRVPQDYPTIQEAINAAAEPDVVLVSPGVYSENLVIENRGEVKVLGAGADNTIIDGGGIGSTVSFENVTTDFVLHGFTIRNGIGDFHGHDSVLGGGIFLEASSPKISNCQIRHNSAHWGGGICVHEQGSPRFTDTAISDNEALSGGALFCYGRATAQLTRCTIASNTALWYGGAAVAIEDSSFSLTSSLLVGNEAWCGGALYGKDESRLRIVSCTIAHNRADEGGAIFADLAAFVDLHNTVLWSNAGGTCFGARKVVQHCDVDLDELAWKDANICTDPQFLDPDGPDDDPTTYYDNDYRLSSDSPCLDAGDNSVLNPPEIDLAGNLRIAFGRMSLTVDLGAYEHNSPPFALRQMPLDGGGIQLIWNSQPNDTYTVWSCPDMRYPCWVQEAIVQSQGQFSCWADPHPTPARKFYRIDMK